MPDNYQALITQISKKTNVDFSPASSSDLELLKNLNLPETVIEFYSKYEPKRCVEGQVRLWPIKEIIEENTDYVPGADVSKHGYIVFSTTLCGDTYCFNINAIDDMGNSQIVLISHDEDYEKLSTEKISEVAKPIAKSMVDFLNQFIEENIDEDCLYFE